MRNVIRFNNSWDFFESEQLFKLVECSCAVGALAKLFGKMLLGIFSAHVHKLQLFALFWYGDAHLFS